MVMERVPSPSPSLSLNAAEGKLAIHIVMDDEIEQCDFRMTCVCVCVKTCREISN